MSCLGFSGLPLLFANDVVLLASSDHDLRHSLGHFAVKCEAAGMRVSTSKSEATVLCWKPVDCSLQVGTECLSQAKEFKYLGVLFTSEGKIEEEIDRRIGQEFWVVTERTRSRIQATEMSFLRRVAGLNLRDRVRSTDIRRELGVKPLLLCVERS